MSESPVVPVPVCVLGVALTDGFPTLIIPTLVVNQDSLTTG